MKKNIIITLILFSIGGINTSAQNKKQILFTNQNQEKVSCYRIPSIVKAPNGDLIAIADERHDNCGDLIYNQNINLAQRISKDNGKSWSEIKTIIDLPKGESVSDPSMIVDKITKEIFLFYNYMNHHHGKEFRFHFVKSKDNGKTWSSPIDITDEIAPKEWKGDFKFITSGLGVQNQEGWLLNTIVRLKDGVYVFGSKDHGKSWFMSSAVAKNADETNIIVLKNGNWLLNSRIKDLGNRKFFLSNDNGKSWKEENREDLIDPTCNASTLVSHKGILFSNLHSKTSRENLGVRISKDEGRTWKLIKSIEPKSSAYSVLVPISKNEFGILYEANGYKDIVFESFKVK